ncbi:MAG: hypothetical protein NVS3B21_07500 [Acidimicrobiales bacterium]
MKHGLFLPNFGAFADVRKVASLARVAEESGWDGLFVWDHVVRREGDLPVADPWVLLTAVAMSTERLVIGPLVTPLPRRRPWNVAKAAVTLDHLSDGRMVLGVGLGTTRGPEFESFGEETDPKIRGDMLDEGLQLILDAWSGEPVTSTGSHYRVRGQRFLPTPVRSTGIPVWVATEVSRGRPVRRAARADGIFPIGITPPELTHLLSAIEPLRSPDAGQFDVIVTGTDEPALWEESGATWWLRVLAHDQTLDECRQIVTAHSAE